MGILLILSQVVLVILQLASHAINVNLWLVFLPAFLFGTLWLGAMVFGVAFRVDSFTHVYVPRARK